MAKEELIRVELISNPTVKRTFTASSWKTNEKANKWRLIDGQQLPEAVTKKKADAGNAGQPAKEPAKAENPVVIDPELEQLRADYFAKTGKPADKIWKAEKIKTEIAK